MKRTTKPMNHSRSKYRHGRRWVLSILALLCLLDAGRLSAAPFSEHKVRKAVETWVRGATADRRPNAVISRLEPYQENGVTMAYVVHLADGGYCLAGADSFVLPVYWYSPKGTYDPKNPGCKAILKEIAGRVTYVRREMAKGGAALNLHKGNLAKRALMWDDLSVGLVASSLTAEQAAPGAMQGAAAGIMQVAAGPKTMVLPSTSEWDQGTPYNGACPELPPGSGNRVVVGCVATAMAQVMQYWRWPDRGVGESDEIVYRFRQTPTPVSTPLANDPGIPAHWRGDRLWWASGSLFMTGAWDESLRKEAAAITNDWDYQRALQTLWDRLEQDETTHSANFGASTYRWNLLEDTYPASVDAESEVAKLSFHAGLAVNMDYGLAGSGAISPSVPGAFKDHFRYDQDVTLDLLRDIPTMIEEIQWYRPLIMCGSGDKGAHCWVVYGYNQQTDPPQFRLNMGWGGFQNGWYTLDNVPLDFDLQNHVTRIAPVNVRFVGPGAWFRDGSPRDPYEDINEALADLSATTHWTLVFKAGSLNTFSDASLVINRPLTLKGHNALITRDH